MCLALVLLLASPILFAQSSSLPPGYHPPQALVRDNNQVTFLNRSATQYVAYSWFAEKKKVRFQIFWRATSADPCNPPIEKIETVPYYMAAVAPVYGGNRDSLYVIGVLNSQSTAIDKWQVEVTPSTQSPPIAPTVVIDKTNIILSSALTHLSAAAASPNDDFLLVQRYETKDILKVNLPSGAVSTVLTLSSHPNLQYYDLIEWQQHTTKGGAFRILQGRGTHDYDHPGSILFWDDNLDGVPELVEELTMEQYRAANYNDGSVWEPNRTLQVFN